MGKQVLVNESSLTNIANALRNILGDTRTEYETQTVSRPLTKISKTSNATSHTEKSGGYGNNKQAYDEITIPGASSINVTISYQTEGTQYDYVQICQGTKSQFNSSVTKYGGKTLTKKNLTFQGDSVTFYFRSDTISDAYLGYYAEITGVDENNETIMETVEIEIPVEVPNIFKPSEMANAIMGITPSLNMRVTTIYSNNSTGSADNVPKEYTYETQEDEFGIYIMTVFGYEEASRNHGTSSFTNNSFRTGVCLITPTNICRITEDTDDTTPFYRGISIIRTNTSFTVTTKGWSHGSYTSWTPTVKVYAILK